VIQLRDIMTTEVLAASAERSVAEGHQPDGEGQGGLGRRHGGLLAGRHPDRAGCAAGGRLRFGPYQVAGFGLDVEDPRTATSDMTIGEAADVMLTNGFRHLPVVEGRELRGVVSIRDVLASGIRRRSTFE
jgi:CBS domain-containing protein